MWAAGIRLDNQWTCLKQKAEEFLINESKLVNGVVSDGEWFVSIGSWTQNRFLKGEILCSQKDYCRFVFS